MADPEPQWPDLDALPLSERAFVELMIDLYGRLQAARLMLDSVAQLTAVSALQRACVHLAGGVIEGVQPSPEAPEDPR